MRHGEGIVPVTSLGTASAATVVWRRRGRLYVTVVVKATFRVVAEQVMMRAAPEPVATDEVGDGSGMGLSSARDLAPYLRYTDVTLTGHAHPPPGAAQIEARLDVSRDGARLLEKAVVLPVPAGGGPTRVVGMGPLAEDWPIRRGLLGRLDPHALEGDVIDIPEPFDWTYFQAAPPDQRIGPLRGDEWVAFEGLNGGRQKVRTRLPRARGAARLYAARRAWSPLLLTADTLHVDVDSGRCDVTWRGYLPIATGADLPLLHAVAGVEIPGEPLAWLDPFDATRGPESLGAPSFAAAESWPAPRHSSVPPAPPSSPLGSALPSPPAPPGPAYVFAHPERFARTMSLSDSALPTLEPAREASKAAPVSPRQGSPAYVVLHPEGCARRMSLRPEDLVPPLTQGRDTLAIDTSELPPVDHELAASAGRH